MEESIRTGVLPQSVTLAVGTGGEAHSGSLPRECALLVWDLVFYLRTLPGKTMEKAELRK